jgi:hypothetical protein
VFYLLRFTHAHDISNIVVHSSDSAEAAAREIALWFPDGVVADGAWQPCTLPWTHEQ